MVLTEDALLRDARKRTGLDDLHLGDVRERLSPLLTHAREEMGLSADVQQATHETFLELLISRAKMLEDRQHYPDLADIRIERPIFVTGLPRSGTTFLHSILAADPAAQAPKWWEVLHPSPPPGLIHGESADRARVDKEIEGFVRLQPDILKSHPYFDEGGDTLMECEAFAVTDFQRILRAVYWRVEGVFPMALNKLDGVNFFRYHRKVLQALQYGRPQKRWALKGTEHHTRLEALKQVYPDAIIVWLHRDPQKVFPSVMALLSRVAQGTSRKDIDLPAFGRYILDNYRAMLDKAMESPLLDHSDVHHLHYADFSADPVAAINRIYDRYGFPFGQVQADAITGWMSNPANRSDRHGKFIYSLDEFDIGRDELESYAAAYRARFAIPYE